MTDFTVKDDIKALLRDAYRTLRDHGASHTEALQRLDADRQEVQRKRQRGALEPWFSINQRLEDAYQEAWAEFQSEFEPSWTLGFSPTSVRVVDRDEITVAVITDAAMPLSVSWKTVEGWHTIYAGPSVRFTYFRRGFSSFEVQHEGRTILITDHEGIVALADALASVGVRFEEVLAEA